MRVFVAIFRATNGTAFEPLFPSGLQRTGAVLHKKWGKNWALVRSMLLFGHLLPDVLTYFLVDYIYNMYIYIICIYIIMSLFIYTCI